MCVCMYVAKMTSDVENKTPLAFLHELYKDSAMERKPLVTDRMNLCVKVCKLYIHTYIHTLALHLHPSELAPAHSGSHVLGRLHGFARCSQLRVR